MKQILLKRIRLTDWKAKNLDVSFSDYSTRISAKNEVGKSSLQQAWNWVLTGYTTPTTTKNADLFDNRKELTPDTPEASVKMWITVDGVEYTIERTAKAKFKRPRGQAEYVKDTSDTYTIKVDDIEMSATNFANWVSEVIAPIESLPYALDGAFFSTLTVNDRDKARAILERMVGSIELSDYIGDYEIIAEKLAKYTPEQIKEQASSQLKPIKKRFDEIPAVVESKKAFVLSYSGKDWGAIQSEIDQCKEGISALDDELLGIRTTTKPILDEIESIRFRMEIIADAAREELAKRLDSARKDLSSADNINATVMRDNALKECERISCESKIKSTEAELESLQKEVDNLLAKFDCISLSDSDTICPTCGAIISDDALANKLDEAKATVTAQISARRSHMKSLQLILDSCKRKLESEELEPIALIDTAPLEVKVKELADKKITSLSSNDEYKELSNRLIALNEKYREMSSADDVANLTVKKNSLIARIEALSRELGIKDKLDEARDEIAKLALERKGLACEMAHLEGIQAKCQEYIEERANIISNRINSRLGGCQVRMFNIQKNGERTPDCVLTDNQGVNYATLSTSAKIRVNIDIQELFRKFYGIQLMTWVDECSIFDKDNLPASNGQCCYLYAGDTSTLKIE